ncbi:hypothetical protein O6H91_19G020500 [Diphasiastrum complanatum]|uniref:Uncharacterized protein n=1 Tax=Diphasiastrum complanatum TaxID=34168 RepID=A0ACC2ATH0_DIPCM|nr:hypothetical protein O6H91_19G020500 [Diphasiastrum complanatum]
MCLKSSARDRVRRKSSNDVRNFKKKRIAMVVLAPLAIGLSLVLVLVIVELYYLLCYKRAFSSTRLISVFQDSLRLHGDRALGVVHDLEVVTVREGKLRPVDGERPMLSDDLELDQILEPSRLLFTIKEETKDDIELSDDGRSKRPSRGNSQGSSDQLRDLSLDSITLLETPFVTAPTSPIQTPPSSPIMNPFSLSRPLLRP